MILKCFASSPRQSDLLKSCQEIYDKNERNTGYFGKNRYMIDVDQAGPLRPFRVLCEFDKRTDNGITVVRARYLPTMSYLDVKLITIIALFESFVHDPVCIPN